jgi:hypothetical protein
LPELEVYVRRTKHKQRIFYEDRRMKSYSERMIEGAKPALQYIIYRSQLVSRPYAVDEVFWGQRRYRNAFESLDAAKAFVKKLRGQRPKLTIDIGDGVTARDMWMEKLFGNQVA